MRTLGLVIRRRYRTVPAFLAGFAAAAAPLSWAAVRVRRSHRAEALA
jgi:hypothetical protein